MVYSDPLAWVPFAVVENFSGWLPLLESAWLNLYVPLLIKDNVCCEVPSITNLPPATVTRTSKNPEELLSISLGSAETTLLKLTSAYCTFVNGGKLIEPIIIDRIQDGEGNTIINNENRKCTNCDKISFTGKEFPIIMKNIHELIYNCGILDFEL